MVNVGIIGARGFTGGELVRILLRHPGVRLSYVTSESHDGELMSEVFPFLLGQTELRYEKFDPPAAVDKADAFLFATPDGEAMKHAPALLARGKKVVDLSGDFRLKDVATYEAWYGRPHIAPELLAEAVYGLPEIKREEVKKARLITNPGCYPTSVILALAPLMKAKAVCADSIVVDSKSGVSGAGGRASLSGEYSYPAISENFRAYGIAKHKHTPEIEQELGAIGGADLTVQFTPHLLPMTRGILTTAYAKLSADMDQPALRDLYEKFYGKEPFVQVLPEGKLPQTKYTCGSNQCHLAVVHDPRTQRVIAISAIDNLVKGAAGQAVQNLNLICGLPETQGLEMIALYP